LNVLAENRRIVRANLQFQFDLQLQVSTPELDKVRNAIKNSPDYFEESVTQMVAAMRELADMWIDSGKGLMNPSADTPRDRNAEVVLPGRSTSLFRVMARFFDRYPPQMGMRRDGTQGILRKGWPYFQEEQLARQGLLGTLRMYGSEWAMYYFADLLDSPDRYRIARCDSCRTYFAYDRARLRTVKYGAFCPKCEPEGSVKRTERSRGRRLDTAAKAWQEWESKVKEQPEFQWIADRVNEEHGTSFGRRWVSQNQGKIKQQIEKLGNAKA